MKIKSKTMCMFLFASVFGFGACAELDATEGDELLDPSVQRLRITDGEGNLYELPYRAELSPAQVAEMVSVALKDEDDNDITLTPVMTKSADKDEPAGELSSDADFEVWPLRQIDESGESMRKVWVNGIFGATTCWSYQDVPYGGTSTYRVNSAFASDGWVHGSNTSVDFDLRCTKP